MCRAITPDSVPWTGRATFSKKRPRSSLPNPLILKARAQFFGVSRKDFILAIRDSAASFFPSDWPPRACGLNGGHLTLAARVPAFLGSVLDCGRRARWHRPSSASLPDRVVYLSLREGGIAAAGSNTAAGCSGQRAARSAQPGPG